MKTPILMSWSGGKDSAMALHELLKTGQYKIAALLTTVSQEYLRISHHGVREILLDHQAAAIGVPLEKIYLPSNNSHPCTNETYEQIMSDVMARYQSQGVQTVAFGEKNLAKAAMTGLFPLWKRDTTQLAQEIISLGFKAYLSCVEGTLGEGFVGRPYDTNLLQDLPPKIDPCGEYGEFHTFVYDGPIFTRPVNVRVGQIVTRDGRHYADLLPEHSPASESHPAEMIPPV
ncbi:MAG: ATP-binding protein [Tepidisphaeraceae bacterium]